ncbi:energy-coupling factor transporter ATPase [Tissierella creatinophila]|uniref:Energy-coupling factor transporter ATP-binding protein EcfA2 n=1 Tax=Tissierella creatinophila DSM 6911 TaxID=1123403 RepID=A0A1U7M472_TISCR|nr:energy-coupling factor transporter ATP-binding protein EcfA2 [Tissierella creatinophila DSM 6911]
MIIKIDNLNYVYNANTPFEKKALDNINLEVEKGEFIGLIGHTGSGKSTLVQHLNGLIRVQSGSLYIDGFDISKKETKLKKIRQKVGLVFQYPEYQLFEETIYKDIAFGPRNLGLNEDEIKARVIEAMDIVGLDYETLKERSPFELSGGQKRRVAIAGVVAMKPKVLVLDEPTAGLDPNGRDEILAEVFDLFKKGGITVVLVSHNMEDIAKIVSRILVMDKGKIVMDGLPRDIFKRRQELEDIGLGIPQITKFMQEYKARGHDINSDILTVEEAKEELIRYLRGNENA